MREEAYQAARFNLSMALRVSNIFMSFDLLIGPIHSDSLNRVRYLQITPTELAEVTVSSLEVEYCSHVDMKISFWEILDTLKSPPVLALL